MNIRAITLAALLFVSSFSAPSPAFAKTTPTLTPTPTGMVEQKVDYTLPYPGILPDHPLYFLKRLRDQILERLSVDPIRKMEFYMLQTDKSVNTGLFLAAKQKGALAQESITRARQYMGQAVSIAATLKKEGKDVPAYLVERFIKAGAKYEEILNELQFMDLLEPFRALQSEVAKLKD